MAQEDSSRVYRADRQRAFRIMLFRLCYAVFFLIGGIWAVLQIVGNPTVGFGSPAPVYGKVAAVIVGSLILCLAFIAGGIYLKMCKAAYLSRQLEIGKTNGILSVTLGKTTHRVPIPEVLKVSENARYFLVAWSDDQRRFCLTVYKGFFDKRALQGIREILKAIPDYQSTDIPLRRVRTKELGAAAVIRCT